MDDFYIGYEPPMPAALARFTRRASLIAIIGAASLAACLAAGHRRLEGGTFAFGAPETVTGLVVARPHPGLVEVGRLDARATLLVAPGKHGATELVAGLDGRRVTLVGTRISRQEHEMLEVVPGSIVTPPALPSASGDSAPTAPAAVDGHSDRVEGAPGHVQLRGEVVDTKCYLGVMVPGEGHTHGACASLCLRGGIPAALLVRNADGAPSLYLLETPEGEALGPSVAVWAGRSIELRGVTGQRGGWQTLRTTPAAWRAHP